VSSTRLRGRYAIRLCVLNHSSTAEDLRRVIEHIASAPVRTQVSGAQLDGRLDAERTPTSPLGNPDGTAAGLWSHPALGSVSAEGLRLVASEGTEVTLSAGRVVVRRWAPDRDFYLVLVGDLEVDVDGTVVRALHAGDFFGELAARDWGSGFGYPRLATVTTRSAVRLWRLPVEAFGRLVASEPTFRSVVEAAVRQRLTLT
jgi:aromatic-L-amino-acid/L-tryptophan decarboxylase